MNQVQTMKELAGELPIKDRHLAYEFIAARNFEDLQDLVSSAITVTKKRLQRGDEESKKIDLEKLQALESVVTIYLAEVYDIRDEEPEEVEEEQEEDEGNY